MSMFEPTQSTQSTQTEPVSASTVPAATVPAPAGTVTTDPTPAQTSPSAEAPAPAAVPEAAPATVPAPAPVEIVSRGILFSLGSIPVGIVAAVIISRLGFIASISSFLIAGSALWLYVKGATTIPRKGVFPLIGVILAGVVLSFFSIVVADLIQAWGTPEAKATGAVSGLDFVTSNLTYGPYLATYQTDMIMFVVFAALGVFGTFRRLLGARKGF